MPHLTLLDHSIQGDPSQLQISVGPPPTGSFSVQLQGSERGPWRNLQGGGEELPGPRTCC